jgi:hypothetical protein
MNEADTLQTFAEVGVALTGFTGIVVVFGRRAHGDWSPVELANLHDLLWASLNVVVFAFLPLVMVSAMTADAMWRAVSGAFALAEILFFGHYWWRGAGFFRDRVSAPIWGVRIAFIGIPLMIAAPVAKAGVALGFWIPVAAFIYLGSLFFHLVTAAINFVFLLVIVRDSDTAQQGVEPDVE